MKFIIELILDLLLEGSIEASKSEKVPKPIRYILIVLISLFFLAVIGYIALPRITEEIEWCLNNICLVKIAIFKTSFRTKGL